MPIIFYPTLNIIKFQLAFTDNLQKLSSSHTRQLALCKRYGQRAHLALNIQLFCAQTFPLEGYDFVTINRPLNQFMDSRDFYAIHQVSLG